MNRRERLSREAADRAMATDRPTDRLYPSYLSAPRPWTPPGSVVVDGITITPAKMDRVRRARLLAEAEADRRYAPGAFDGYSREEANRRIVAVFSAARMERLDRGQIQDPAIRDALSLT